MQNVYNGYKYHTFPAKIYFPLLKVLKSKKKVAVTCFVVSVKKHDWMNHESFFA